MEGVSQNINVSVRIRPLNGREVDMKQKELWRAEGNTVREAGSSNSRPFVFDHVFDTTTPTSEVYTQVASPILSSCMNGVNGTIFAYGQTSSGKTHTMLGTERDPGCIRLAVQEMFDTIEKTIDREWLLRVSFLEIYNEVIRDLLSAHEQKLKIHECVERGVFVDAEEAIVTCPDDVFQLMVTGEKRRHVGATNMNERSSRSHTIFKIVVESRERNEDEEDMGTAVKAAALTLVDLAGSERVNQTGAEGTRLKEGININKSLLTLGTVISKLAEGSQGGHVPYRDSKLTRILQPSLGGNARTSMICAITPAAVYREETLSTLQFATRAKRIMNDAKVNELLDDQALLRRCRREIQELKTQLSMMDGNALSREIQEIQSAKEETLKTLEMERAARANQEEKIKNLTALILSSSPDTAPAAPDVRRKKTNRRETWCPGHHAPPRPSLLGDFPGLRAPMLSLIEETENDENEGLASVPASARMDDDAEVVQAKQAADRELLGVISEGPVGGSPQRGRGSTGTESSAASACQNCYTTDRENAELKELLHTSNEMLQRVQEERDELKSQLLEEGANPSSEAALKEELASLKHDRDELSRRLESLLADTNKREGVLVDITDALSTTANANTPTSTTDASRHVTTDDLVKQLESDLEKALAEKEEVQFGFSEMEKVLQQASTENEMLVAEVEVLKKTRADEENSMLTTVKEDLVRSRSLNEELEAEKKDLLETLKSQQSDLDEKSAAVQTLSAQVASVELQLQQVTESLQTQTNSCEQLSLQLQSLEKEHQSLLDKESDVSKKLKQAETSLQSEQALTAELRTQAAQLRKELTDATKHKDLKDKTSGQKLKEMDKAQQKIEKLEARVKSLTQEKSTMQQEKACMDRQLKEAKNRAVHLEKEVTKMKNGETKQKEIKAAAVAADRKCEVLRKDHQKAAEYALALEKELEKNVAVVQALQGEIDALSETKGSLEEAVQSLQEAKEIEEKAKLEFEGLSSSLGADLEATTAQKQELEARISDLSSSLVQSKSEVEAAQADLVAKQEETLRIVAAHERKVAEMTLEREKEVQRLEAHAAEVGRECACVKGKLEDTTRALHEAKLALAAQSTTQEALSADLTSLTAKCENQGAELDRMCENLTDTHFQLEESKSEGLRLQTSLREKEEELAVVKRNLDESAALVHSLRSELSSLSSSSEAAGAELESLRVKETSQAEELATAQASLREAINTREKVEEEIECVKAELDGKVSQCDRLDAEKQQLEDENANLAAQIEEGKKRESVLESKVQHLEIDLRNRERPTQEDSSAQTDPIDSKSESDVNENPQSEPNDSSSDTVNSLREEIELLEVEKSAVAADRIKLIAKVKQLEADIATSSATKPGFGTSDTRESGTQAHEYEFESFLEPAALFYSAEELKRFLADRWILAGEKAGLVKEVCCLQKKLRVTQQRVEKLMRREEEEDEEASGRAHTSHSMKSTRTEEKMENMKERLETIERVMTESGRVEHFKVQKKLGETLHKCKSLQRTCDKQATTLLGQRKQIGDLERQVKDLEESMLMKDVDLSHEGHMLRRRELQLARLRADVTLLQCQQAPAGPVGTPLRNSHTSRVRVFADITGSPRADSLSRAQGTHTPSRKRQKYAIDKENDEALLLF
eukprot:Rmarinus@m.17302